MTKKQAEQIAGTLSVPSKMPGRTYGLPAEECLTGAKLVNVPGSVCHGCYALKGFYKLFAKTVKPSQYRHLEAINSPLWVSAMVTLIRGQEWFRWHDSGDLQSYSHLAKIVEIAQALPEVNFWLPTREYAIVRAYLANGLTFPENLTVRLSAHMVDGPVPTGYGLPVSGVHSTDRPVIEAKECPARYQDNKCGDCRACWSKDVQYVSYHQH